MPASEEQKQINKYEKIYFERIKKIIEENGTTIFRNLTTQYNFVDMANNFNGASQLSNVMERVIQSIISENTDWEIFSDPASSDSSFITPKCVIHIDSKAIRFDDNDAKGNKITVGKNQTSYASNEDGIVVNSIPFQSNIPHKYNHKIYGKIFSATYFIKLIYNPTDGIDSLKSFKLILTCIPNGELREIYGDSIFEIGRVQRRVIYKKLDTELYNSVCLNLNDEDLEIFNSAYDDIDEVKKIKGYYKKNDYVDEDIARYLFISFDSTNEQDKYSLEKEKYEELYNCILKNDKKIEFKSLYTFDESSNRYIFKSMNNKELKKAIGNCNSWIKNYQAKKKKELQSIYDKYVINNQQQSIRIKVEELELNENSEFYNTEFMWNRSEHERNIYSGNRWAEIELY